MKLNRLLALFVLVPALVPALVCRAGIPAQAGAFLERHCMECHDEEVQKGGLNLSAMDWEPLDEAALAAWVRLFDRVEAGEMPPEKKPRPEAGELKVFLTALGSRLTAEHVARKGTVLRRLNRREFANTLNDLFGTRVEVAAMLPEDGRAHEFDNVGEALAMSEAQLQRYLEAVDAVLQAAIARADEPPEVHVIRSSYATEKEYEKHIGQQFLRLRDGAVVFFSPPGYPSGTLKSTSVPESGYYKIRVIGYAYQSKEAITFQIGTNTFARGAEQPILGHYSFRPGAPQTVEIEAWLPARYMIEVRPWGIWDAYQVKNLGVEHYKGPGLAVLGVELEGPLTREFPSRGHRLLFDGLKRVRDPRSNPRRPAWVIESDDPAADVRPVIHRLAQAAFRRPVRSGELEEFNALFKAEITRGADFETALRATAQAVFCAPESLYLLEPPGRLDDHALAARLSYFLTRTAPDAELRADADAGLLAGSTARLVEHAERLMKTAHFERFIIDFTDAWLNLREIDFTMPDATLYPEFDLFLRDSMLAETRAFFRDLIERNLGARHLVKPEHAMLNNRLARHYGIEGVEGPELRRVPLPADAVRGGLLAQASVHKVSANGTNTSPVVRGVWVLERLFGQVPPPPPPGVPGVEPDIRGAATLRELLEKHRDSASCNACHRLIDPPGFALENFNPIGGWDERYRSLGNGDPPPPSSGEKKARYRLGSPVDASGQLKDGRSFDGFLAFRDMVAEDEARLARALLGKLLTFATGREIGFSDRPEITRLMQQCQARGHGLRHLLLAVVQSDIFQTK